MPLLHKNQEQNDFNAFALGFFIQKENGIKTVIQIRFKGTSSDEFIDQKSILSNIAVQAEEAYNFVLRHINKGAAVEGVYTVSRWEYPVKAIREAIVHRDYSLSGKDVKVAVYDDIVEITSPGLLPPSIDYSAMESRQSDARNKVIAPVFKQMGIIDQWGNGLKLIANELKQYPQIELRWKEPGLYSSNSCRSRCNSRCNSRCGFRCNFRC